jgi:hypothetical protein
MDLKDYASLAGILSILIVGANFVVMSLWKLTFGVKVREDEKRFIRIETEVSELKKEVNEHEDKNKYFRHNFDSVTKNLEVYISSEIKHLGEIIGLQIKNILEKFNEKK